jgi:hypothetical protein
LRAVNEVENDQEMKVKIPMEISKEMNRKEQRKTKMIKNVNGDENANANGDENANANDDDQEMKMKMHIKCH